MELSSIILTKWSLQSNKSWNHTKPTRVNSREVYQNLMTSKIVLTNLCKMIHSANMRLLPILRCLELVIMLELRLTPLSLVFWCNQFLKKAMEISQNGMRNMKDFSNWDFKRFLDHNHMLPFKKCTQRKLTSSLLMLNSLRTLELESFQSTGISIKEALKTSSIKLMEFIFQVTKSFMLRISIPHTLKWLDKFWVKLNWSTKNHPNISQ